MHCMYWWCNAAAPPDHVFSYISYRPPVSSTLQLDWLEICVWARSYISHRPPDCEIVSPELQLDWLEVCVWASSYISHRPPDCEIVFPCCIDLRVCVFMHGAYILVSALINYCLSLSLCIDLIQMGVMLCYILEKSIEQCNNGTFDYHKYSPTDSKKQINPCLLFLLKGRRPTKSQGQEFISKPFFNFTRVLIIITAPVV